MVIYVYINIYIYLSCKPFFLTNRNPKPYNIFPSSLLISPQAVSWWHHPGIRSSAAAKRDVSRITSCNPKPQTLDLTRR